MILFIVLLMLGVALCVAGLDLFAVNWRISLACMLCQAVLFVTAGVIYGGLV